uniref:EOG090X01XB n=1 Tax=Daphnia magna TaxID=35525 RepID=A0A4Y7MH08_9CRUS|nr:EOG090X01XB [Daphnia magna]
MPQEWIVLKREDIRLRTFNEHFSATFLNPLALAKAGFFYVGVDDQVQCAFCRGVVKDWEVDDDPVREHQRLFPSCPFVLGLPVGNVPLGEDQSHHALVERATSLPVPQQMNTGFGATHHFTSQMRPDAFPDTDLLSGKEASTSNGPAGSLQVEEKRRRAWEQWSADDIAAFFEGLNEFGKDFDAIQNCLYTKNRKKSLVNSTNIKNKDQVRHFYYRTWHKISKYLLPTPDEGKRMHKELYGLINYGEMWKKLGGYFNDRCGEKLNELVQHGVTSVKIKGKSYRIKTPVCPALKRLQSTGTETQKLPSTPERIVIELTPCCNADFLRVQSVAHNPRIRISTDSSSPLSTIISFLTKKWKPRSILEAESVAEDELIMRVTPEMKQVAPIGSTKKGRKRTFSGQEQMDETEVKLEVKSWILETSDQVTFSRMRQRLRRPLRYGTSLKRGSLAATLSKMPGPSPIQARPHPSSLMAQSTTVNITWPPEENGNGTGSFVLQVQLDGQQQQTSPQKDIPTASVSGPLYLSPKKGPDIQNGTGATSGCIYLFLHTAMPSRILLIYSCSRVTIIRPGKDDPTRKIILELSSRPPCSRLHTSLQLRTGSWKIRCHISEKTWASTAIIGIGI